MRLKFGFSRQTLEFSDQTMELSHQAARGLYIYIKCVISIMNHASHHQNATAWHLPSIFSGQAIHAALHQGGHLYQKKSQGGVKPFTTVPRSKDGMHGKVVHPFVGVRVRYTFQSMEWWPSPCMVYNRYNQSFDRGTHGGISPAKHIFCVNSHAYIPWWWGKTG